MTPNNDHNEKENRQMTTVEHGTTDIGRTSPTANNKPNRNVLLNPEITTIVQNSYTKGVMSEFKTVQKIKTTAARQHGTDDTSADLKECGVNHGQKRQHNITPSQQPVPVDKTS